MMLQPLGLLLAIRRKLIHTTDPLEEHHQKKAARMLVLDGVCVIGMMTLQGGVFLPAFALLLGASNYQIGLLTTIALISQLMQIPGLALVNRIRHRRLVVVSFAAVSRLIWLPIILIPFFFVQHGVGFLLLCILCAALTGALAGPAWNSLLRDVVPTDRMGGIFGKRLALGTALALAVNIAGGWFVDRWAERLPEYTTHAYSILFLIGLLLGLVALVALIRIPEPAMRPPEKQSWLRMITEPMANANFRHLILFVSLWTFALNMAIPFFIIYMLNVIGLTMFAITILTVISQLVNLLFLGIWGRLADRLSNKSVLVFCCPLFLLSILAWCFTLMPDPYPLTLPILGAIQIFGGIAIAGISIGVTNIAFKLCPNDKAPSFMTVFGLCAALAGAVAPLLGGAIADLFASRRLEIPLLWITPEGEHSIALISLQALDFLFLFTFLAGLLSLRWLRKVQETGEVSGEVLMNELLREVSLPLKSFGGIEGMRRATFMPVSIGIQVARKVLRKPAPKGASMAAVVDADAEEGSEEERET